MSEGNLASSEPKADIVLIDPDFRIFPRNFWKRKHHGNRKISQVHVKNITHDMENSDFDFNGDAIRISKGWRSS